MTELRLLEPIPGDLLEDDSVFLPSHGIATLELPPCEALMASWLWTRQCENRARYRWHGRTLCGRHLRPGQRVTRRSE